MKKKENKGAADHVKRGVLVECLVCINRIQLFHKTVKRHHIIHQPVILEPLGSEGQLCACVCLRSRGIWNLGRRRGERQRRKNLNEQGLSLTCLGQRLIQLGETPCVIPFKLEEAHHSDVKMPQPKQLRWVCCPVLFVCEGDVKKNHREDANPLSPSMALLHRVFAL